MLHDPAFWGFLTAVVGAVRWLARVFFVYKMKAQKAKAEDDTKLIKSLMQAVSDMKPVIEKHSLIIGKFEETASKVFQAEARMSALVTQTETMVKGLTPQIVNLSGQVSRMNTVISDFIPRFEKIETEIIQMRNDFIFVRTKR